MADERPIPLLVLHPQGRLDVEACGELRHQLAAAFRAGIDVVGFDLSGVSEIDQVCTDLMRGASRHLTKKGGDLVLTGANEAVATTIRINGLGALLERRRPALRLVG